MKDKYILEIPIFKFNSEDIKNCDIIEFKINNEEEAKELKRLLPLIEKPLMIIVNDNLELLINLMQLVNRECIFGIVDENNYKEIIPHAIKHNHTIIIRTPIDINLAKEMNILTTDIGLSFDKIIMDTDIGGLGYGFEYGYSMIEKIKLESGDKYLNLPIISFAAEETSKTKEAKDKNMALFMEISATTAVKACGADYIVFKNKKALETVRGLE